MATQVIKTTFQFKRGTAERWNEVNPILSAGEPGYETNTNLFKIGDGETPWQDLEYCGESSVKRTNDYNYKPDFIANNGQICFVDTARNGLQDKIGDGITPWSGLNYLTANEVQAGLVKLYDSLGDNVDGTMTQKAITRELKARYKTSVDTADENLIYSL